MKTMKRTVEIEMGAGKECGPCGFGQRQGMGMWCTRYDTSLNDANWKWGMKCPECLTEFGEDKS